jgi:hypothetical protein
VAEFPITREVIGKLEGWLSALAKPLLPAVRINEANHGWHWEFSESTPYALVVAKCVRMVSGINAAVHLVEAGYVTEVASILRMVADFATEVIAVSEAAFREEPTAAQRKFVSQFFVAPARTPAEYEQRDRQSYVSRRDLMMSHARLAADAGEDPDEYLMLRRFVNRGLDGYVHGAYLTAMELYNGGSHRFEVAGVTYQERISSAMTFVSGKLHEVITAFELTAMAPGLEHLHAEIRRARIDLEESGESSPSETDDPSQ